MTRLKNSPKRKGFSLLELLITLAIVSILVTVGYPSYIGFIQSGKRSSAQSDLLGLAASLERHRASNYSYKGAATGGDTGTPSIYSGYSPSDSPAADKQYDLTIDSVAADGSTYVIKATPATGSTQIEDGDLFYYSDGRKAWDKNRDGAIAAGEYCWSC